jgi:hypothetical protein
MRCRCFFATSKNGNLESNKNDMNATASISRQLSFAMVMATLIFGFGSCKKDPVKSTPQPGEYLNSNVGSNWSYSTTGTSSSNWTVKVEDSSVLYLSNKFQMYKTNTAGVITRNYYRYSKGNYSVLVLDADGATQEIVYLKDSTQTGKKWSKSIKGLGGILKQYNYEVIETGSKTVGSKSFENVVHIRLNIPSMGYTSDAYYAPKVGLIMVDDDYASSSSAYHTEIKSYDLK